MRRRDIVAQNKLTKANKQKERRASRGPEEIRRSQDLQNAARQRASQQSEINQNDASMYQPPPAPNITTSSSSSSSSSSSTTAFVDNTNQHAVEEVIDIAPPNDNEVAVQRRVRRMLAIQNHVRGINTNHQINVNAVEEVIDIAPVIRPRNPIDNEILYQVNPLRRNNALMAIQALIENERIDIQANARNAGLNI
jgi:hypothetical protein